MSDFVHIQRLSFLILSVLLLPLRLLFAQLEIEHVQQIDTIETTLDLFGERDPLHMTLTLDLKKFHKERYKEEYVPAHLLYQLNDSVKLEKEIQIKARGNTRKNHCTLAPFWLDLRNANLKDGNQQEIEKIKIVTHCKNSKTYEKYVLKEYLCYEIYRIITPVSFGVRLVRMTYVDTGRDNKLTEGWAFMIEPVEMLAQRFDAVEIKTEGLFSRQMRPVEMNMMALFQYLIGNPDFSVPHRHNVKILGMPGLGTAGYTAVPYDFDYSGLVNAYYAVPAETLDIKSVTERYYLGPCRPDLDLSVAIEQLNQYREEILQLVQDFQYLDKRDKKSVLSYLEAYFDQAVHVESLVFGFQRTCL